MKGKKKQIKIIPLRKSTQITICVYSKILFTDAFEIFTFEKLTGYRTQTQYNHAQRIQAKRREQKNGS